MSNHIHFPPFDSFIEDLKRAQYEIVAGLFRDRDRPGEQHFNEIKSYLLDYYSDINAVHSWQDSWGQVYDCIPVEKQPTLRKYHLKLAKPVAVDIPEGLNKVFENENTALSNFAGVDSFGNKRLSPAGTIPLKRISLETMLLYGSLKAFLDRRNIMNRLRPMGFDGDNSAHAYAAVYENRNNSGGFSILNIWQPPIQNGQNFSLSQQWFQYGSGGSRQVIEGGWTAFPAYFKFTNSVFFIHWTPDNYAHGCFNMDGPGFVQYNSNWAFDQPFTAPSIYNGTQSEIPVCWKLMQDGNWWLYLYGLSANNAIGYYPGQLFGAGRLAQGATAYCFGGEVSSNIGSFPPMGSGYPVQEGYTKAAYQRHLYCFTLDGSFNDLNPSHVLNAPYTLSFTPATNNPNWGNFIFFGGRE